MTKPRSVPISDVREHLNALKERHSLDGIALAIGLSPRRVHHLFTSTGNVYARTAAKIIAAAQGSVVVKDEVVLLKPSHNVVLKYLDTAECQEFVEMCRRPAKYRCPV